jgi:hypothetical protein
VNDAWSRLRRAAWLAAAAHAAAGVVMLLVLGRGLETAPNLESRLRFIAENSPAWTAGWLVWNAAALSILYYCVCFAAAHAERGEVTFAVALCSAAVACDLAAQSVFMGVLPQLARPALDEVLGGGAGRDAALFLLWHRGAVALTGYVANGLYTCATLLLCWTTRREYPPATVAAGLLTCAGGVALSVAALAESVAGMFWANVLLMPSLIGWLLAVGREAARRARLDPP